MKFFAASFMRPVLSALCGLLVLTSAAEGAEMTEQNWDKVFAKSEKVDVQKVNFKNRYGITLVGDLYVPKGKKAEKLPAIAVSGPFGAVKEQSSGLYAQTMAERGFITLAFDASYTGESGGEPRLVASPDINTEDFSAAVDYLSNRPDVDADKIGIIGICGFGGFALNAAAMDTRIKATVTSTMYDMSRVNANGYFDTMGENERYELKRKLNAQRTEDFKNGTYAAEAGLPGFEPEAWVALFAPAGTPQAVVDRLHATVQAALQTPEVQQRAALQGIAPTPMSNQQLAQLVKSDTEHWGKIIKANKITVE